jgi:hypothetical protein
MRNKYPGICFRCGKRVEPRQGHFERAWGGADRWRVQHAECAIKYRGTMVGRATLVTTKQTKEQL